MGKPTAMGDNHSTNRTTPSIPPHQAEEISFLRSQNSCVSFVDIVNSTQMTSIINNPEKVRKYYEIFLNTVAAIARDFGAKIVKNVGDCLIFYYPETSDSTNKFAFRNVLECCLTIVEAQPIINEKLTLELVPQSATGLVPTMVCLL
jgi:class 3 adenylate cyclase